MRTYNVDEIDSRTNYTDFYNFGQRQTDTSKQSDDFQFLSIKPIYIHEF